MKQLLLATLVVLFFSCKQDATQQARTPKQYSIEQFYKNINLTSGALSTDDRKLLYSSDESGIYNGYEIDLSTGDKKPRTSSATESIFTSDYIPGTNNIIYSSDSGGNENYHLFLLGSTGSEKDLTPGSKITNTFWGWSRDGKAMYFISNKRDARYFDFYKMDTASWQPLLLYKNEKGWDVNAISPDENYLLLSENITSFSSNLYLADRGTISTKKINSDSTESLNGGLQFSLDNKSFYYLTDEGSEFQHVMKYDLDGAKKENFYSSDWDVMYMYTSRNEKYHVIGVNEDGRNKIYVFDHQSGKPVDFPKIEDGDVQSVNISQSEQKMELLAGSSKSPNNLYVYDFNTKELKQLTHSLNTEIDSQDLVSAQAVRFKSFDGLEIPAVYYKPMQASETTKVPALIWVHGGPGGQSRVGYSSLIQYFVNQGYAILAVNNRGSSGYGKTFYNMDNRDQGNKDLKDCIWGKKYLQSQNYIDSSSIGILGGSYGGYMVLAALCFQPDEFKVGVDLFGVSNWLRTLRSFPPYWESFIHAFFVKVGDPNSPDSVRLKDFSPLLHADNIKKPLIVLQGANDVRVLKIESDQIVEAVKKNSVPVQYVVFPDEGHGFLKKENEIKGYGEIKLFLDRYLKGDGTATTSAK